MILWLVGRPRDTLPTETEHCPFFGIRDHALRMPPASGEMPFVLAERRLRRVLIPPVEPPSDLLRSVGQTGTREQVVEHQDVTALELDGHGVLRPGFELASRYFEVALFLLMRNDTEFVLRGRCLS